MPLRELIASSIRRRRRRSRAAADRLELPRLPHRRADHRCAGRCSRTTGSTSTSRSVKLGRIQNFKNWSPDMVPGPAEDLPRARVLLLRGRRALDDAGRGADRARHARARADRLLGGGEGRRRHRRAHAEGLSGLRRGLRGGARRSCASTWTRFSNLQVAGRNGMHKYNNQDHSMLTAMLAVENLAGAAPRHLGGQRRTTSITRKAARTRPTSQRIWRRWSPHSRACRNRCGSYRGPCPWSEVPR